MSGKKRSPGTNLPGGIKPQVPQPHSDPIADGPEIYLRLPPESEVGRQRRLDEEQDRINRMVDRAIWSWGKRAFQIFGIFGTIAFGILAYFAHGLRSATTQALALNDSMRSALVASRGDLARMQNDLNLQRELYAHVLNQYQGGFFQTLHETANLQSEVSTQKRESARALGEVREAVNLQPDSPGHCRCS